MRFLVFIITSFIINQLAHSQDVNWSEYISVVNEKNINTVGIEFSPSYWQDDIVFVKSRTRQNIFDKNLNEPYFDLYLTDAKAGGYLKKANALSPKINSAYHEGPATFDNQNNKIIFTRVDYDGANFSFSSDKSVILKIFSSEYKDGIWSKPAKHSLNKADIPSCHPTLNANADILIFASDRPGGYGKMDLYISYKNANIWSEPVNMGPQINSEENDWFPFINDRNYLFYSSLQSEQYDIKMSELIDSSWTQAINLPSPINSQYDDFGLIINEQGTDGYLTSNRPGGLGKDDIYSFNSLISIFGFGNSEYNTLNLKITDKVSNQKLSGAKIKYRYLSEDESISFDESIFKVKEVTFKNEKSDLNGLAKIKLHEGFTLIEINYPSKKPWQLILSNKGSAKNLDVKMEDLPILETQKEIVYIEKEVPVKEKLNNVSVDVGAVIVFDNIYYNYNSSELTLGAKKELDKLAEIMLENQNLKIELSAHTDSRGKTEYNQLLSDNRATSAKKYLLTRGIISSNIVARGYGETQLRNHCSDKVNCSEAEHIYNRRTEVRILQK